MFGIDEANAVLVQHVPYDQLFQKGSDLVRQGTVDWNVKAFDENIDPSMTQVGVECRRWLSQAL